MLFAPSRGVGIGAGASQQVQSETQRTTGLNAPCTGRSLAGPAIRRNPRSAQFRTCPGNEAAAAPVTAVHTEMGVRVTAPQRTESSIPVPMATNPR
eukprot:6214131-Pleurochrysis_carterae.AAC.3